MANLYKNQGLNLQSAISGTIGADDYAASGSLVTCPPSKTLILKGCQISNNSATQGFSINTTVDLVKSGSTDTFNIISFGVIPSYSSLDVLSDNLVLEEGDSLYLYLTGSNPIGGTFSGSLSAIASYMEIT